MSGSSFPSSLSVVIPAYNEEPGIEGVVRGLRAALEGAGLREGQTFEILVVDDGSGDRTAALAEAAGVRVLRHPANRGYGRSLLSGFEQARFPWVLMLDADGSYPPEEAARLLPLAEGFDMVVGARQGAFFWGDGLQTFLRLVYLSLAGFVAGEKIPDANSGLRLIRKEAFDKSMPVLCYGYSLSTTMTLSFLQGGRFVRFVPIAYQARLGKSKVRSLRDIPRTLQIMTQVILYYNPLKFMVVLAAFPAACAAFFGARWALLGGGVNALFASLGALGALATFLCGCLLESLRLHRAR